MQDLTGLGKLADSKLVNKAYEDLLAEATKEGGKAFVDLIKAFRLFTAPIQLLAVAQDRLAVFCERVRQRVPEDRRVEAPPCIALPILLSLRVMEDDNPLTELYLNLLARAIDKERLNEAHPAFVRVIEQMSPDEAMVMYVLRDRRVQVDQKTNWHNFPVGKLAYPEHLFMYFSHLGSLGLLIDPVTALLPASLDGPLITTAETEVTQFGRLFIKACIPENHTPA